jgi:hypothetical protein
MPDIYLSPSIRVRDKGDGTWVVDWNNAASGAWEEKFLIDHDTGELLRALGITGDPPKIRLKDTGASGAERRIASDGGSVKVLDDADVEVMDIESHQARHAQDGDDPLVGILLQDTAVNRPAAGTANRFFLATDTMELSRDNGTAWESIGVLGGLDLTAHKDRHLPGGADPLDTAVPGNQAIGDTAAEGIATSFAKSDHKHGTPAAGAPVDQADADVAAEGTAATLARSDHKHGMPADYTPKAHAASHKTGGGDVLKQKMVVQAHKSSVGNSQSDAEIFEFTAPLAMTLSEVQVYCTATAATASVDVKEAGITVLSAGAVVKPTVSDPDIASGAAVTVHVTTNGTGTITDLTVTLVFEFPVV